MKSLKENKGITLLALIVTIIVLLILSGISIAMLVGDNGIYDNAKTAQRATRAGEVKERVALEVSNNQILKYTNREEKTRDEVIAELVAEGELTAEEVEELESSETPVITIGGIRIDFSVLPEKVQTWTQDGTSVTDGEITLTVGQAVTGYSVDVEINSATQTISNWYVLGAKNGELLITTNTSYENVTLSGIEDYVGGVAKLNTAASKYSDGDMANSTRTLDMADINRITGYNPEVDGSSVGSVWEYGNEVTYTLKDGGTVSYQGTKQPTTETDSSYTQFQYWNGTEIVTLATGESTTLTCTAVNYNASSADSATKAMLFTNTGAYPGASGNYWLGSPYVNCNEGYASWGLHIVYSSNIRKDGTLFYSYDGTNSYTKGLRPVVSLKSSVKVTDAGAVSK